MDNLTLNLKKSLDSIADKHGNKELIIAYSGGIDSQVLLHALMHLKQQNIILNKVSVCHVNHGLSDNASDWQQFGQQICAQYPVNFIVKCVDVQAQAQKSLEALARDARYNALKSLSDKPAVVLTGHHSDDQTETYLLALKRGAGLKGLSSMAAETPLGQHLLARPLLNISRQEIEIYAQMHALTWVEDESNTDTRFDRNFIRQQVMPLLRSRWPSIQQTINRSASHCFAGQELLDELAEQDLYDCRASEDSLYIEALKQLSPARFNNLIRFFMAQHHCLMPGTEQVNQLREQLRANADKTPQVKVADYFFRRFKSRLFLTPEYSDISDWQSMLVLSQSTTKLKACELNLPDNLGKLIFSTHFDTGVSQAGSPTKESAESNKVLPRISLPKKEQQVSIRFSHDNPRCLPHFRLHSRTVKKVLQELNIAPWQRKRIAFLYYDNELVAAIGHFICKAFIAGDTDAALDIVHDNS